MIEIDFKNILENSTQAVAAVNFDDSIVYANKYFCSLFSMAKEEVENKCLGDFLPKDKDTVQIKDYTYKITKFEDEYYTYFYLSLSDTQMEKIYSDFISTVSHELRTPLTSIRGFADTMLASFDKLDKNQIQKFLNIIKEQSNRLIKLVENLLSVSRIQVEQSNFVYKSINPKIQIEKAMDIIKNQYPSHVFELKCSSDVQNLLADENKFQQIMINLLDNAAKYSYDRGSVTVRVSNSAQKENFVSIKVEDHGVGIDPENMSKIFEKFARIENHLTRKTQGSGLGLYIVKNLIEKMGGQIFVESSTVLPNSGSTFEILLPAASYTNQSKKVLEDK